ncbi:hypothetical protein FRX31_002353 [Thalictrum thalictroides]|uniref:SUI1 domain-containing protein n=1 Tax=Thalictrum thalictroides TaxID=46969 RepID=A0A7J6XHE4_THATH|nr:hypothetical protein FRX31_002353 [Thalictrum thalictroides]
MNASNLNVVEKDRSPSVNSEIYVIEDSNVNESQSFKQVNHVHLRVRKHNGDVATIFKAFKEKLHSTGEIVQNPDLGRTIQLEGDHRKDLAILFVQEGHATLG